MAEEKKGGHSDRILDFIFKCGDTTLYSVNGK